MSLPYRFQIVILRRKTYQQLLKDKIEAEKRIKELEKRVDLLKDERYYIKGRK